MNKLSLDFITKPEFSYSYSKNSSSSPEINKIEIGVSLFIKKNQVGSVDFDFQDLLKKNTQYALDEKFEKDVTIALYEKMVEQLNNEIKKLK